MGSWLAAVLVTPVFGLSLQLEPSMVWETPAAAASVSTRTVSLLDAVEDPDSEAGPQAAAEAGEPSGPTEAEIYVSQLRRRAELTRVHRTLGIATWVAMTATAVTGAIQYYNMYGIFADQGSNPCVTGRAIFGQGQCSGTAWPHRISALTTAGLYASTLSLALLMPDPDDATAGDSEFARNLRMHKILRWVHLAGMVAQLGLGVGMANNWFGLDRANDYRALQALGTAHMGLGLVTWGAMSWAAALMVF